MRNKTLEQLYTTHQGKISDKWSSYLIEYERILKAYRNRPVMLLEIGVQNGGSLEIWSKYFPHALKLVGCDINPDCAHLSYEDPRIAVVVEDANSDNAQTKVLAYASTLDVIIDDGSHRSGDIVESFARYFPHLADGGVFIIEDLHCSYWQEFQGGLFDPFSSITFFKRLADVVSHEHWGIEKARADILGGIFSKYGIKIDEKALQHVHSVEFINSMCVIRKDKPMSNRLGARIIAGSAGIIISKEEIESSIFSPSNQISNKWTARSIPPEEELLLRIEELTERERQINSLNQTLIERDSQNAALIQTVSDRDGQITSLNQAVADRDGQIAGLNQAVADRDGQIAGLNQAVAERDGQIAGLNQAVAERDGQITGLNQTIADLDRQIKGIFNSISWKVTKPLRAFKKIKKTIFWTIFNVIFNFIRKPSLLPFKQFHEYIFIRNNSLFDKTYYLKNNLDVARYGIDPAWHYIKDGAREGRNPSINFDTSYYLANYSDVAASKVNPLYHFIKHGKGEGRFPSEEAFPKNSVDTKYPEPQKVWIEPDSAKNKIASLVDLISGLKNNELEALGRDRDLLDEIPGPAVRILDSIQCQHGAGASFNGQRVAVLAHWDPDAVVDPYVIHYLAHFKELGWSSILISDKAITLTEDLMQVTDAVLYRTCLGYDFTSWKGALEYFPSLIEAEELILTNDSIFAPIGSLSPMHSAMQEIKCDYWGAVGSREHVPHLQSYYLVFRSKALRHEAFARFWAGVQSDADRKRAIQCETVLSLWLALQGLQPAVYAPMPPLNDDITNPAHDFWRQLIDIGIPFFKRELLKENARNVIIDDCMDVLADAGYPIHLIANYFNRIGVTPTVPMPPRALAPEGVWPPDVRVLEIPCNPPDNCAQLLLEEKDKIGNVGIFLHIYYEDLTEELVQCALCVPEPRRIYISTDTRAKEVHIRKILELHGIEAAVEIRVLPNRGWDIAPFLVGFADRIREHSILLRLHSKRSFHISCDIGTHWRQTLFNILAGSREHTQGIMRAFAHNPELGMVCSPHASVYKDSVHFGGNYVRMEQLLSRFGITIRPDLPIDFPMGSMFWCRRLVLEPWLEMQLCFEDFEPTLPETRDQTLAHSMERLFFFGCGITGHRWTRLPMPR